MTCEVAAVALVFGAFALAQAVARQQPLDHLGRARVAARALALAALVGAVRTAAVAVGTAEAVLVVSVALAASASVFVPLAGVSPRWAWRAALAAPVVWLALVMASGRAGS